MSALLLIRKATLKQSRLQAAKIAHIRKAA